MKKLLFLSTIFAMAMVVIPGCNKPNEPVGEATKLTLSIPASAFKVGTETAFTVMTSVNVEADLTVSLTSSNPAAATVPASVIIKAGTNKAEGKINGVALGKSTIKIAAQNVEYAVESIEVSVTEETPPTPDKVNVSISNTHSEVAPGAKIQFKVVAEKAPVADLMISVASSSAAVATVPVTVTIPAGQTSVTGDITGVAAGQATITITSDNATIKEGTISITVKEGAATVVELSIAASKEIEVGDKTKFTITTPVSSDAALTINISSSNTAAATVPATITLPAGAMSVQGDITAVKEGTAKITISAAGTTIKKADADVTVIPIIVLDYCVPEFSMYQYALLNSFKLGDVKVVAGDHDIYTGTGPLSANFEFDFNPQGTVYDEPTGAADKFMLVIYADWGKTGKLTTVHSQEIIAGSVSKKYSGTLTIPADAANKSLIRAVTYYKSAGLNASGCGKIESGTVVDFTYTK